MIRINLLPFRAARKTENIRRQVSIFILSIILSLLFMGTYHVNRMTTIRKLSNEIEDTKKELVKVEAKAKQVDKIEEKLATLGRKNETMKQLDKGRKEPVILFDTLINMVVPNRMWYTNIVDTAQSNQLTITGIALDNKTTADFMKNLEHSNLFTSVRLSIVKNITIREKNLKSFVIICLKKGKTDTGESGK